MELKEKINILLVDDRPSNLLALEAILEELNQNLVKARSGEEALSCLLREDFALILLDVTMPGMDGFETASLIRARPRSEHVPIIFVTGINTDQSDMTKGYSLGAVDYISTPLVPEILRAKVAVFIELHRQRRELRRLNETLEQKVAELQETKHIKTSLEQKEVMLREIHHRVKNNMQVISSLLQLQASFAQDKKSLEMYQESQNRIQCMAMIHEKLYQSESLSRIDFAEYIKSLTSMLIRSYAAQPSAIRLETKLDDAFLSVDTAIPVGLIINELVTNSLKYAYRDGNGGVLSIGLQAGQDNQFALSVRDNGAGLPKGFSFEQAPTLGLRLVKILAKQLGAGLAFRNSEQGAEFTLTFRETKEEKAASMKRR